MKVIIHTQTNDDVSPSLDALINRIRHKYIMDYVDNLQCSTATKHRLVQSIADTIRDDAR